jgi:hypothetical protein
MNFKLNDLFVSVSVSVTGASNYEDFNDETEL